MRVSRPDATSSLPRSLLPRRKCEDASPAADRTHFWEPTTFFNAGPTPSSTVESECAKASSMCPSCRVSPCEDLRVVAAIASCERVRHSRYSLPVFRLKCCTVGWSTLAISGL